MTRKVLLTRLVKAMLLIGVFMAAYPFVASLGLSEKAKNNSVISIEVPKLESGKVTTVSVQGLPLIFLKPNINQLKSISLLDAHVWDDNIKSYNKDLDAYIYWGLSTRRVCLLSHHEQQVSQLKEWSVDATWFGGYWDPSCEVSYDYAGRAIKTYEYTFNGYTMKVENLKKPSVFHKTKNGYVVSIPQR